MKRRMLIAQVLICLLFNAYLCAGGDDKSQYLYETAEENHYVYDFTGSSDSRPDFIYSPSYPNGRVVTYYAHWCPHCIHFKPKYITFSEEIKKLSQKFDATVETFAVSCVPQSSICKDKKIHGYPTIMFYPPFSVDGVSLKPFNLDPEEIFKMAGVSTTAEKVNKMGVGLAQQYSSKNSEKKNSISESHFISRTRSEAFHDAHLSFHFAMKTAIFTQNGPLPEKPKEALRKFLSAMKRTLPPNSSMQTVVRALLTNFESIVKSPVALESVMSSYPPPEPTNKWSKASLQHGTGYTAGLWTLFHIMSVGLVHWNYHTKDDREKLTPAEMADILRNYVEYFFQCEECRLNFLTDFDACMYDRCNRLVTTLIGATAKHFIQYPLWLYETHNAVNTRLRKERIEQKIEEENFTAEREVIWPPYASCPSCWASTDKDRWDEVEVYKFLQQSYWLEDDGSDILRTLKNTEAGIQSLNRVVGQSSIQWDGGKYGHDASESSFHFIRSLSCLLLGIAVFWYRRRRYDQRGIHKKIETTLP